MIFRVYYALAGAHVHCRVFSGPAEGQLGKCGDLTMRLEEFRAFMAMRRWLDFRPEPGSQTIAPPEDGRPMLEYVAALCLDRIRECLTSEQRDATSALVISALQDSFELGFKAAGGSIFDAEWRREP